MIGIRAIQNRWGMSFTEASELWDDLGEGSRASWIAYGKEEA